MFDVVVQHFLYENIADRLGELIVRIRHRLDVFEFFFNTVQHSVSVVEERKFLHARLNSLILSVTAEA